MYRYTFVQGNLLDSKADVLVCPVNVVGTMGAGLALQFKKAFLDLDDKYQEALRSGQLTINTPYMTTVRDFLGNDRYILLFPTKFHYRDKSRYAWVARNLRHMQDLAFSANDVHTVALPKLGCGLGGLEWPRVFEQITTIFGDGSDEDPWFELEIYGEDPRKKLTQDAEIFDQSFLASLP